MSLLCGVGECLGRQFIAKITARTAVVHRTQVDHGIHEKVGQEFWDCVAAAVSEKFREGDFTGGLVKGIEEVGRQLSEHFPFHAQDKNELSDEVDL